MITKKINMNIARINDDFPYTCKGCRTFTNVVCLVYAIDIVAKRCPCNKCLVKVTCGEVCEERKKFQMKVVNGR